MPPKHTIDQTNQGMLLAPPPASVRFEGIVGEPGAYFRPPEVALGSEEQEWITRLEAEHHALDSLAQESKSAGNATTNNNLANRVAHGVYRDSEEQDTSLEHLSDIVARSTDAVRGLRLASKGSLADSLGIQISTEPIFKVDEAGNQLLKHGKPQVTGFRIVTQDPAEQAQLDTAYRRFRIQYAGTRGQTRRVARRTQLKTEIKAIKAGN